MKRPAWRTIGRLGFPILVVLLLASQCIFPATLSIDDVTLAEGDIGTTSFTFTVTLDNAVTGGVSVDYSTADGSATAASGDYAGANGTLNFAGFAGEQLTITVNVNGDTTVELDETFTVTLTNTVAGVAIDLANGGEGQGTITDDDANEEEVIDEIERVLPDMGPFELVKIDDAPIVASLEAAVGSPDPIVAELPILDASGNMVMQNWIAYHINVRDVMDLQDSEEVQGVDPDLISGPSMTFRGIPDWDDTEFPIRFRELVEAQEIDEAVLQPSVLNIIGGKLEGAFFTGGPGSPSTASVIDNIENLPELHVGADEAQRLASMTSNNYIVYRHENFQPDVEHGETIFPNGQTSTDGTVGPTPQSHTLTRILRPVMVADLSIYDPTPGTWLINNWFARVDSAANRQNAYLWLANIAPDIASGSTLTSNNNRIFVRTVIAGYRVLTPFGESLYTTPTNSCNGSPNFVDEMRKLSHNFLSFQNEYWMWWTRNYGGGCAYINTLGSTPFDGAVGWSGFGSGTVDWTSFVFMHESGHIIGGTHTTNNASSPETVSSHRCNLFGFWPIGPTGPSLMSYASGTRTYCFAATPASGTPKRNLTKVAEYLHNNILP